MYVSSFCHCLSKSCSNRFSLSNSSHMCSILPNTFIKHLISILSQDLQLCLHQINIVICLYDICWCCWQNYTQWFCKSQTVWTDIQTNKKCLTCDALYEAVGRVCCFTVPSLFSCNFGQSCQEWLIECNYLFHHQMPLMPYCCTKQLDFCAIYSLVNLLHHVMLQNSSFKYMYPCWGLIKKQHNLYYTAQHISYLWNTLACMAQC